MRLFLGTCLYVGIEALIKSSKNLLRYDKIQWYEQCGTEETAAKPPSPTEIFWYGALPCKTLIVKSLKIIKLLFIII